MSVLEEQNTSLPKVEISQLLSLSAILSLSRLDFLLG